MLLRFEVSNHRSILDPVELSMIAIDEDRPAARPFDLISERVLPVAGIYGANASGKSNVLDALGWLSSAIALSLRAWEDGQIPREPFKFGFGPTRVSTFEAEMMVDGVRFVYRIELGDERIEFEGLYSYPQRRRRAVFERVGNDLTLRRGTGSAAAIRKLIDSTTLILSIANRFDVPGVSECAHYLARVSSMGLQRRGALGRRRMPLYFRSARSTDRLFLEADSLDPAQLSLADNSEQGNFGGAESALALLKFADLGIDDVQVVNEEIEGEDSKEVRRKLQFNHRSTAGNVAFDLFEESEGTQTWYRLIGPVLQALRTGRLLLLDEIDASLHPKLSARLLELFKDPISNVLGAQLVFTSHDTSLLNHLNRDEVWLTEKGRAGSTTLTALADYGGEKVRRSMNLERAYLQGRFGAVPEFDQYQLQRALGLTSGDAL